MLTNTLRTYTFNRNSRTAGLGPEDIVIDIESEVALAAGPGALANRVIGKLLAAGSRDAARRDPKPGRALHGADRPNRSAQAVYSVVTSPEYALQP